MNGEKTNIEKQVEKRKAIEARDKVTQGVSVKKEKGMLESIVLDYIKQDVPAAINNVIENTVWPGIKGLTFNFIVETARQLLSDRDPYGSSRPLYSNQQNPYYRSSLNMYQTQGRVNNAGYNSFNNNATIVNSNNPGGNSSGPRRFNSQDYEFRDKNGNVTARIDAQKTLDCLKKDIEELGYTTVANFLRTGGFGAYSHYGYQNIGWTDLSMVTRPRATLTGYVLDLPDPISVRNLYGK